MTDSYGVPPHLIKDTPQSNTLFEDKLSVVTGYFEKHTGIKVHNELLVGISQLLEAEKKRLVEKVEEIPFFDGGGQYENGYDTALRTVLQKLS